MRYALVACGVIAALLIVPMVLGAPPPTMAADSASAVARGQPDTAQPDTQSLIVVATYTAGAADPCIRLVKIADDTFYGSLATGKLAISPAMSAILAYLDELATARGTPIYSTTATGSAADNYTATLTNHGGGDRASAFNYVTRLPQLTD